MSITFTPTDEPYTYGYTTNVGNGLAVMFTRSEAGRWNVYVTRDDVTLWWREVFDMISDSDTANAYRARNVSYHQARSIATKVAKDLQR